jgi:RNA polymerase sigma factor (sigma-70 family)
MRDPFSNPRPLIARVYGYVAYRIGDGPEAEDVTSETFERALRYRESFDPARGSVIPWLIGIARRCIADAAERITYPITDVPELADARHEDVTALRLEVRAALVCLDQRDQELLALRFGGDLSARQIAELLDLKTNAVEVAIHRALARLRRRLDPPPAGEGHSVEPVRA